MRRLLFLLLLGPSALAAQQFPLGTYAKATARGPATVSFADSGAMRVVVAGSLMVEASFTASGDTIAIVDQGGPAACPSDQVGRYRWTLTADTLVFAPLADSCEERVAGLSAASWTRQRAERPAPDTAVAKPLSPAPEPLAPGGCGFCPRPNLPVAIFEGFLINAGVNRFNAWVLKDSTARVTTDTWRYNLHHGWDWDKDDFVVNMLGHPYNGSVYFAAARSNGLSYWVGVPFTFFNSVVWEYFGETTRPSINDLVDTGLGGSALGEMFHRVAETIRNNELGGGSRAFRELAALPFDPVGSFNRLLRGDWSRRSPNPAEHNPLATVLRVGAGAGIVRAPGSLLTSLKDAKFSSIIAADLKYGDSYIDSLRKPFDAFSARILLAPGHGGLTQLVGVGRVTGREIGRTEWHRHQLELNQRFEYLNNGALQFGAQTLELGVSSRVHLKGRFWFRSLIAGDGIVLAGINAPGAGVGLRNYDFGPGVGGTLEGGLEHAGIPYLTVHYQPAWIHTVNGANANHYTTFLAVEGSLPILDQLSLVVHSSYYDRLSRYADGTRNRRHFPELRVFAAFKTANRRGVVQ